MSPHRSIHQYTWMSPEEKTHYQIVIQANIWWWQKLGRD
jgi:hypothetical protein